MDDLAVKVDRLYKDFVLPHERASTLKGAVTHVFRRTSKEKQHALKDISIEVRKGEFFGIVGRNGSGKSTLLKILASIYQPTKGRIKINGRLIPFIELGVGFNPELSGRDNVFLNGAMFGFSKREVKQMYEDIVKFAELEEFMDKKLKNYSSGMQVRLAFSMATRANADILLVDEVLAVGDESFQRKCFQYFKQLKRDKKTVIFVTHDMGAVREFCDRAILIDDSEIKAKGNGSDIADLYSKMFIDDPLNSTNVNEDRWGDGKATISKVVVKPKIATDKDKIIELSWDIKANSIIAEPMYGFSIKNAENRPVVGTNTVMSKIEISSLKPKDKIHVAWQVANVLPDGVYSLAPAMGSKDNSVHDWWEGAVSFEVRRAVRSPFPIQADITGKITRGE